MKIKWGLTVWSLNNCSSQQSKFISNRNLFHAHSLMSTKNELKRKIKGNNSSWAAQHLRTTTNNFLFSLITELLYWNSLKTLRKEAALVNTYSLCTKWLRRSWVTCSCHAFLTPVLEGGAAVGIELRFPTLPEFVPSFISGLKLKQKGLLRVPECRVLSYVWCLK